MDAPLLHFNSEDRCQEKEQSRHHDERNLSLGQISEQELRAVNGFFSVLDRSRARLVARRVRYSRR